MGKNLIIFFSALSLLLLIPGGVSASLVVVNKDSSLTLNVLSSETSSLSVPKRESIEIKRLASIGEIVSRNQQISLRNENGKVELNIEGDNPKNLDVTNFRDDLIEIEERGESQKLIIGLNQNQFSINQEGTIANTDYPIKINSQTAEISVSTPSGSRFLAILPIEAVESGLRSRAINDLKDRKSINLIEEASGVLVYKVEGNRILNIFNLFDYRVPVSANISATNGEVVSIDQPPWLKVLGFLFV